jgi:hypothetical protein
MTDNQYELSFPSDLSQFIQILFCRIDYFGCFDWFKGDRYEGEWKNEAMHGLGSYVQVNSTGSKKEYTVLE